MPLRPSEKIPAKPVASVARATKTVGPAFQGSLDPAEFSPCPLDQVRLLAANDRTCLQKLQDAVDSTEWDHSTLSVDDPTVFGYFFDGQLVAASKNVMRSEDAADHGVVTHPHYRRRGFGKTVVCASVTHAIEQGYLVIYQTLATNAAAVKIAQNLGFVQYGQSLAVRFKKKRIAPTSRCAGRRDRRS